MRYLIYSVTLVFLLVDSAAYATSLENNIRNYYRVSNTLATSGSLGKGAEKELVKQGFKTIIDLRTKAEGSITGQNKAIAAGMDYINIPVVSSGVSDAQLKQFTRIFEIAQKPVLVHCISGNRVGAMLTRYYISKGMSPDKAFNVGRAIGMRPDMEAKVLKSCEECD